MHAEVREYVARILTDYPAPRRVLEIGGKNINGTVRGLFADATYTAIDVVPGPGVDVVANGATYQPAEAPDCVVCCEVLEHAMEAPAICANAHRILAPGGLFILTAASEPRRPHSAIDGGRLRDNEFYHNVSEDDLTAWLAPFAEVNIEMDHRHGDIRAVTVKGGE